MILWKLRVIYPCFDSAVSAGFWIRLREIRMSISILWLYVRLKYARDLKNRSAMVSQFAQRLVLRWFQTTLYHSLPMFSRFLEGTSRLSGDWSLLRSSWDNPLTKRNAWFTYFNFMCCVCCGLAPILFRISVGSFHAVVYGIMKHKGEKEKIPSKSTHRKEFISCDVQISLNLWRNGKLQLPFAH